MLELDPNNTVDYLREYGHLDADEPATIEALGWGVSNVVMRVTTPRRLFVLKQSRPQLRTQAAWFSDVTRIYREQEVMQMLGALLPAGAVPEVLFVDRDNYAFAMSHAPLEARVWKETLLRGETEPAIAEYAGTLLGRIHQRTAEKPALVEPFADSTVFVQLRVDPFYRRVKERHPDLSEPLDRLIERMLTRRDALCHGDFSPKNFLTHGNTFMLVDFEAAYWGDPTMDIGFFLSHLLLKGIKHASKREAYLEMTQAFWRGYEREARFLPLDELHREGMLHCGACVLARVDGTSPVDYLNEPERAEARSLGRSLLS